MEGLFNILGAFGFAAVMGAVFYFSVFLGAVLTIFMVTSLLVSNECQ